MNESGSDGQRHAETTDGDVGHVWPARKYSIWRDGQLPWHPKSATRTQPSTPTPSPPFSITPLSLLLSLPLLHAGRLLLVLLVLLLTVFSASLFAHFFLSGRFRTAFFCHALLVLFFSVSAHHDDGRELVSKGVSHPKEADLQCPVLRSTLCYVCVRMVQSGSSTFM